MEYTITAWPYAAGMLAGMLICLELGRRFGVHNLAKNPSGALEGISALDGAVFGLFGLMIAFTFSGAPSRLDARRHLAVEEANAVGTAYLRLDLLPADSRSALQEKFRKYTDSRIDTYRKLKDRKLPSFEAAKEEFAKSVALQNEIWSDAVAATQLPDAHPNAAMLLMPALNAMIDITITRTQILVTHPPGIIFGLLFLLALVSSLLAGYGMAGHNDRSWLHIMAFTTIAVVTVFVVLQIEFPRLSILPIDEFDQVLVNERATMK